MMSSRINRTLCCAKIQGVLRGMGEGLVLLVGAVLPWASDLQAGTIFPPSFPLMVVEGIPGNERFFEERTSFQDPIWPIALKSIKEGKPSRTIQGRDPFQPLKIPTPVLPGKPSPKAEKPAFSPAPPPGTLLSVVHGPWGFQAVIQLSSQERIIVEPGGLLKQSGWLIKDITEDRVLLEFIRPPSSFSESSRPQTGVLSFR